MKYHTIMRFITLFLVSNFIILVTSTTTADPCADDSETTTTTSTKAPTTAIIGWSCPSGWTSFVRSMGHWCMKVIAGTLDRYDAESACVSSGGVLSGIENSAEQQFIINKGVAIVRALPGGQYRQGALWVGAQRIQACADLNENATGCNPWANNAYHWTDGFTTLKKMMIWTPGQPDYYLRAEYCVQMSIVNRTDGSAGAVSGDFNDISCTVSTSTAMINYIRGYVCGQRATPIFS